MYRHAILDLEKWGKQETPKPLVLRGARQVGKSTLVRMYAERAGLELVEVNLEKKSISEFNNQESFSIEKVITEIEIITKSRVTDRSIIFIDEIQAQPAAVNALRYFYEDRPGLKVVAAGSLFEVMARRNDFGMPVGRVEYYYLGPMTFSEFLLACNEDILAEEIQKIDLNTPPSNSLHLRAIELLKKYYFVGGMPEVVKAYVEKQDFSAVRDLQNALLQTYKDDVPKYSKGQEYSTILAVMDYCIHNLGKKVIFRHVTKRLHSSYVKRAIETLALANIIYKVCHSECNGLPLSAGANQDVFKLYFLDVGLYNCYTELEWRDLYALSPEQLITKGCIAEQFIAQHLAFRYPKKELSRLHYWLRGERSNAAEIDFVISHHSKIYPLEVKSGSTGKLRSLWQFVFEKRSATALRLDLSLRRQLVASISHQVASSTGSHSISCKLIGIPLYAVENIVRIVESIP
jgi:predicted AAA+ superfamily ATPase